MTTIPDGDLLSFAARVKDKVVLITGGASGIGKETALLFAKHGAKVAVGDVDQKGCDRTLTELRSFGSDHLALQCDVTSWDDQVKLFQAAHSKWGAIDVVIPNAGVSEIGDLETIQFKNGKPLPPNLKTMDINLTGVLYTIHLGLYYLKQRTEKGALRAIVILGSMASWQAVQGGPIYAATKHAMLGLMRSLYGPCRRAGVRIGSVHPGFAATNIITPEWNDLLETIPKVPVSRVAKAIFCVATHEDMNTSGYVWMLPDDQSVLRLEREQLREGIYRLIDARLKERMTAKPLAKASISAKL